MGLIKSTKAPQGMQVFSMARIEDHARGILLRAQQESEQLLAAAVDEAELLKQQARAAGFEAGKVEGLAKGYEDGRKNGHDQALNEHRVHLKKLVESISLAINELEVHRHELESTALVEVVQLAVAIARRVTKRQGLVEEQVLIENLSEAMKLVVSASDIRIVVHPSQVATLERELPNLKLQWPKAKHLELIGDAGIAPGGCRLINGNGEVKADLGSQLDRIINDLLPTQEG